MSITGSTPQSSTYGNPMPMVLVLGKSLRDIQQPEPPLLRYPVGGFVVLMLIIMDMTLFTSVKVCQIAVWHRFLFHLVEKYCTLLVVDDSQAVLALQNIHQVSLPDTDMQSGSGTDVQSGDDANARPISKIPSESGNNAEHPDGPRDVLMDSPIRLKPQAMPSAGLDTICGTYLVSEEDLEEFQRLADLFEPIEDFCSAALDGFLKCLLQHATTPSLAIEVFDKMRAQEDLYEVFHIPENY